MVETHGKYAAIEVTVRPKPPVTFCRYRADTICSFLGTIVGVVAQGTQLF